jgi:serine/threonine protein phosphatase PrpC
MNEEKGSATLSIITVHPHTGVVRSYHVGDSIFAIFKKNEKPIVAEEQQKAFNVPFQVHGGKNNNRDPVDSDEEQKNSDIFHGISKNFNYNAIKSSWVVLASDGLWDNVSL